MAEAVERAGGWPDRLRLPMPSSEIENEAMNLFLAELREATGAPVAVDFITEGKT